MTAGPNPFVDAINIWFRDAPGHLAITITSTAGARVWERSWPAFVARSCRLDGLGHLAQGIYYVSVVTDQGEKVFKMSRIAR